MCPALATPLSLSAPAQHLQKCCPQIVTIVCFLPVYCHDCYFFATIACLFSMYCHNFPFVICVFSWLFVCCPLIAMMACYLTMYCNDLFVACILLRLLISRLVIVKTAHLLSSYCNNSLFFSLSQLPVSFLHFIMIANFMPMYCHNCPSIACVLLWFSICLFIYLLQVLI